MECIIGVSTDCGTRTSQFQLSDSAIFWLCSYLGFVFLCLFLMVLCFFLSLFGFPSKQSSRHSLGYRFLFRRRFREAQERDGRRKSQVRGVDAQVGKRMLQPCGPPLRYCAEQASEMFC